jgi:acetolactate synthase I/II/III large subunit
MEEKPLKLSDYVARFLALQGITHVFAITGGAAAHLIDSVAKTPGITYICPAHEQAAAMAADAYARVTGKLGVAIATSGPGATNMLTGVLGAFYDSVPVLYITGQVSTFRLRRDSGCRQLGFQEADVVDIFRPGTKYAVLVTDPRDIRYELEKAVYLAKEGRPGPVLVDIPDNLQREFIDPEELAPFVPNPESPGNPIHLPEVVSECIDFLNRAKRPIVILGWGVRLARAEAEVLNLVTALEFPVVLTWATLDLIPSAHPLVVGSFGTHGTRYGNFAVQNADLVLSLGSRLDTHHTGTPISSFAREAKKIIIDIDANELNKFRSQGIDDDLLLIEANVKDFAQVFNHLRDKLALPDISAWKKTIASWKDRYPICPPAYDEEEEVNPYIFYKTLSRETAEEEIFFSDTGCGLAWMMQGMEFKKGQRCFSAFNYTPMGFALPASLGASLALNKQRVIAITGDGGLQMNIQELATVVRHNLPVKIFLINNHGYSMIQQTQDQWLDSRYEASTVEGGLAFPDFEKVAESYGFRVVRIDRNRGISEKVREVLATPGHVFCNVEINRKHRVIPQVKFGRPIEDSEPFLARKEFLDNMIVQPMKVCLE